MIDVICHTNLDLPPAEKWPNQLPAVPRVGDTIQSSMVWSGGFQLSLEVVAIRWECSKFTNIWKPHIELHIGKTKMKYNDKGQWVSYSLVDFYKWYAPLIGRTVSSFI